MQATQRTVDVISGELSQVIEVIMDLGETALESTGAARADALGQMAEWVAIRDRLYRERRLVALATPLDDRHDTETESEATMERTESVVRAEERSVATVAGEMRREASVMLGRRRQDRLTALERLDARLSTLHAEIVALEEQEAILGHETDYGDGTARGEYRTRSGRRVEYVTIDGGGYGLYIDNKHVGDYPNRMAMASAIRKAV